VTNAPMFAGSKICHSQFTALPSSASRAALFSALRPFSVGPCGRTGRRLRAARVV
jgi:hypothetical protein